MNVIPGDYANFKSLVIVPEYYQSRIEPLTNKSFDDFSKMVTATINPKNEIPEFWQLNDSLSLLDYSIKSINVILEGKILNIIGTILSYQEVKETEGGNILDDKTDLNRLNLVRLHIDEHFGENLKLDELVQIACMSKTKLIQLFKAKEGMTIYNYIQEQRTNSEKKLLITTDVLLKLIAEQVGYTCHSSFTEVFKNKEGMTPSEFRNAFSVD